MKSIHRQRTLILLFMCLLLFLPQSFASEIPGGEAALWQALKEKNTFGLLRHTLAPGTGDPPNFTLRDCTTQRLLSNRGKDQARSIGTRFRENNITAAEIYSSQWCRCLETAALINLGPVNELLPLNSFFQNFEDKDKQTEELKQWLGKKILDRPLILVTHQVNITAFTGIFPSSGEMIVVRKNDGADFTVLGSIAF